MRRTATPTPVTHIYKEINIGKYSSVKHYELHQVKNGESQLHKKVKLSNNRAFAKSKPYCWFGEYNGKKWLIPFLTGLFITPIPNVYYGDAYHKNHLLIFEVDEVSETLTVHYYVNYFTHDIEYILNKFTN